MKINIKQNQKFIFKFLLLTFLGKNSIASYYGRFTTGGFVSKEIFRNDTSSNRYNDIAVFSQRAYLSVDKIADGNHEFQIDIRDKHNFFDKLDRQRLTLTSTNEIQLHQLSLKSSGDNEGLTYSLGRFSLVDAGSVYVDGADLGIRTYWSGMASTFSLFYGYNPNNGQDTDLTFTSKRVNYGIYHILESKNQEWNNYFYSSTSLVRQLYKSEVDRFYLYQNLIYQNSNESNFTNLMYLDLVPKLSVQNLWMSYNYYFLSKSNMRISASTIDSLNYQRIQDVREELPSSRYHQFAFMFRTPNNGDNIVYENKLTAGTRLIDKKNRIEYRTGAYFPNFLFESTSGNLGAGARKNFTSNDFFISANIMSSNIKREISLGQEIDFEKKSSGISQFVSITSASYTRFFERNLFGILSLQNTWDDSLSIFSILFKISYRFGEGGQAPIRDGSPPMGQL